MKINLNQRRKNMSKKYVFIDWNDTDPGYGIDKPGYQPQDASPYGVEIVAHMPLVDPIPMIVPDKPWEATRVGCYSTVIKVGDEYRMWYDGIGPGIKLCYATSKDGLKWEKPSLGIVEFEGSYDNNILFNNDVKNIVDEGWCVIYQENAPESERFKMVFTRVFYAEDGSHSVWIMGAVSEDGLHWSEIGKLFRGGDTQTSFAYDEKRKKYVIITKAQDPENIVRRTIIMVESDDFKSFSEPVYLLHGSPNDPPDTDYYTSAYHIWKDAENAHLLFPARFHRTADFTEVELLVSRDLSTWNKPSNGKVVIGPEQTFRKSNYADIGVIEDGNGNWIHVFSSYKRGHHDGGNGKEEGSGLYRLVFREDGYTSLHAKSHGCITTLPRPRAKGLKINADIGTAGYIKIAATDPVSNIAHDGFDFDDCTLEAIDCNSYEVRWKKPLSEIPEDIGYRFKIKMFRADLYSYTLDDYDDAIDENFRVPYVVG